jgi:hypothetical protein
MFAVLAYVKRIEWYPCDLHCCCTAIKPLSKTVGGSTKFISFQRGRKREIPGLKSVPGLSASSDRLREAKEETICLIRLQL